MNFRMLAKSWTTLIRQSLNDIAVFRKKILKNRKIRMGVMYHQSSKKVNRIFKMDNQ